MIKVSATKHHQPMVVSRLQVDVPLLFHVLLLFILQGCVVTGSGCGQRLSATRTPFWSLQSRSIVCVPHQIA